MEMTPITVTALNKYMKDKVALDEFLNHVLVKGEISNFKHHYTGHMYFTLKDENSLIKCIMFKSSTATLKFVPKDGAKVIVYGTVSVFERDGVYQIYCKSMKEDGVGSLFEEFEKRKQQLEKEGLFDEKYKKKIPFMPKVIGILTSQTGSVIRDIINVSTRRNPNVYIRLLPVPVQGDGAAEKIASAIAKMNEKKLADVLILARGGGSLEDLWPFNEEVVARAIFASQIPIISAVGHETDFTIADFVADLRAPTPSAAAELACADVSELKMTLDLYVKRYKNALKKKSELMRLSFEKCMGRRAFSMPTQMINDQYVKVDRAFRRIENSAKTKVAQSKAEAAKLISKLDALSPLKVLSRGYCLAMNHEEIVHSVKDVKKEDMIQVRLLDGMVETKVQKIHASNIIE